MHLDPLIPPLVGTLVAVLMVGLLLQAFHQPQLVGYIVTGFVIGPGGLGLIADRPLVDHLGSIGVTLLLFFIGMEVSPRQLIRGWRVAILGTLLQIIASVAVTWGIGVWLDWSLSRIVLLGFVVSLSSTAVVLKLLKDAGELSGKAGDNVLLILLTQDLAVVPMLILISYLGGGDADSGDLLKQSVGAMVVFGLAAYVLKREIIPLPFARQIRQDHELQVFAALLACFGLAFITGSLGISAALGAFVAGMVIAATQEMDWIHRALEPLRVIFVALFFVSVGMLIQPEFIVANFGQVLALVLGILLTNTFINAGILRWLGDSWPTSLYSGALLAQIGEFSFVLATVGLQAKIISNYGHQLTIAVIALSLVLSPAWILGMRRLIAFRTDTGRRQ
jgi:CPA2 family monovalent cation:H+ antiporter-2